MKPVTQINHTSCFYKDNAAVKVTLYATFYSQHKKCIMTWSDFYMVAENDKRDTAMSVYCEFYISNK